MGQPEKTLLPYREALTERDALSIYLAAHQSEETYAKVLRKLGLHPAQRPDCQCRSERKENEDGTCPDCGKPLRAEQSEDAIHEAQCETCKLQHEAALDGTQFHVGEDLRSVYLTTKSGKQVPVIAGVDFVSADFVRDALQGAWNHQHTEQAQGRVCDLCGKEQAKDADAYCKGHGEPAVCRITVNMREHDVEGNAITYEQVAALAGKPGATHLTMTYHKHGGPSGSLIAGERVELFDDMHFCAVNTSNA